MKFLKSEPIHFGNSFGNIHTQNTHTHKFNCIATKSTKHTNQNLTANDMCFDTIIAIDIRYILLRVSFCVSILFHVGAYTTRSQWMNLITQHFVSTMLHACLLYFIHQILGKRKVHRFSVNGFVCGKNHWNVKLKSNNL